LLLSLAACVSKTTIDVIKNAMESVKTKTIIEWHENNIRKSVQAKRMSAFRSPKTLEQKSVPIIDLCCCMIFNRPEARVGVTACTSPLPRVGEGKCHASPTQWKRGNAHNLVAVLPGSCGQAAA
jgi:hypothetical protein